MYISDDCFAGSYDPSWYSALNLVGKSIEFQVDLNGAGCGCDAAVYLVSMPQNTAAGSCDGDYYCDANFVCQTACSEIDIMEANTKAWHSTLHLVDSTTVDSSGSAMGLGGDRSDFTADMYGPSGSHIDTNNPFTITMGFPAGTDDSSRLSAITVRVRAFVLTRP